MKIIKIKEGKPVDDPINCGAKSLSEISSGKISEHSLSDLVNKNSETYDVIIDESLNDNFFIGIDGITWRDVLENENADSEIYDLNIKKVYFRIEKKTGNVFCLKTNGIETLIFNFEEEEDLDQESCEKMDLMIPLNGERKVVDYMIGGEFHQCIMCMRDLYECLVKEILGDNWDEKYSQILKDYNRRRDNNPKDKNPDNNPKDKSAMINVEFSNFYIFVKEKRNDIDEKKGEGVSQHIEDTCSLLRTFRNINAHNLGELVERNRESLVNAIGNMKSIARVLGNAPVEQFLSIKAKRIKELKK